MSAKLRAPSIALILSVALLTTSISSVVQPANADLAGRFMINVKLQNVAPTTGRLIMNVTLLSDHTSVAAVSQVKTINNPKNGQVITFSNLQTSTQVGQFSVCVIEPLNGFKYGCTIYPITKHRESVTFSVP